MRRSIRSIKRQMLALFLGLIILIMGLIFALNSGFLEQYYVSNKLTEMTDMYQLIDDLLESDKLDNEAALNSIWRKAGRNNLSINVVDRVANSVLYTEQVISSAKIRNKEACWNRRICTRYTNRNWIQAVNIWNCSA